MSTIPGYAFGSRALKASPMSEADFEFLKQTVLWTDADVQALRQAGGVLDDQVEAVLDVWYGFVGGHPHLAHYFSKPGGGLDMDYLGAVRRRFAQWIRDTCAASYDRAWLDYQYEIGLRHTHARKNRTDQVQSAAAHIHLRYLVAFIVPITATIKPFLAAKGHDAGAVARMHDAWFKSVTMQVTLWAQAYTPDGSF